MAEELPSIEKNPWIRNQFFGVIAAGLFCVSPWLDPALLGGAAAVVR
jgi:hypothetical protein